MKRFLLYVMLFVAGIAAYMVFALCFLQDMRGRGLILATSAMRHELLARTASPKIVLVGGSGVSSGIDSTVISNAFQRPVVNMSVNAGMGIPFMLNEVREALREGDVVVLIPEYKLMLLHDSFRGGNALVRVVLEFDPASRRYMTPRMWWDIFPAIVSHAYDLGTHPGRIFPPRKKTLERAAERLRNNPYSTNFINAAGDAYGHWDLPQKTIKPDVYDWPDAALTPAAGRALAGFKREMEARGVMVVFLPPAFEERSYRASVPAITSLTNGLAACGMAYDAPPERYVLPDAWFYDSPYHPLRAGVEYRTRRMVEDIAARMAEE